MFFSYFIFLGCAAQIVPPGRPDPPKTYKTFDFDSNLQETLKRNLKGTLKRTLKGTLKGI